MVSAQPLPKSCMKINENQIQSHGYPSHNRNGYRPAKQLQPAPCALRTTPPGTIFPDALVLLIASMETEMIGIKVDPEFKKILQEAARDENRSLSNFIKHCLLTYLKEKKGIDYKEEN